MTTNYCPIPLISPNVFSSIIEVLCVSCKNNTSHECNFTHLNIDLLFVLFCIPLTFKLKKLGIGHLIKNLYLLKPAKRQNVQNELTVDFLT